MIAAAMACDRCGTRWVLQVEDVGKLVYFCPSRCHERPAPKAAA